MARPSYRVHLVTHHDGMLTGWLLSAQGAVARPPSGHGRTDEEVFGQLALQLEEFTGDRRQFLWTDALRTRKVKVQVHPQTIVKKRHVIAKETVELELTYAWSKLERGGFRVIIPRFGWWFVLEDMGMAAEIITQSVSSGMLGKQPRSLYEFRTLSSERVVEWSPTLSRAKQPAKRSRARDRMPTLHAVAEELVDKARRRRGRPVIGEIQLTGALGLVQRKQPRSLLLVGPAGAGKTTWVYALARHLARRRKDARAEFTPRLWSTSADRIIAGMKYLGMWEQRCLDLVSELSGEGDYLYVDRLAPLLRTRTGHSSIADMFLPALRAGELSLIAECSIAEHEQLSSRNPVLASCFHAIQIRPTPSAAMPAFLRDYQARVNPRLVITPPALRRLVQHLDFFQRDIGFPGKGVRFLGWLNQERGATGPGGASTRGAPSDGDEEVEVLDEGDISLAFARSTGLPLELISEELVAGPEAVAARLRAGVIGQDDACRAAARVLTRFKAGLNDAERPIGSLFFVGPTGVGKTELAKQLARYMFGDVTKMIRLDMSEYMLPGASQRLLAVGRGVLSLVERVRLHPLSLILLDEIEKAHAEVFDLLLAMLGEGRMTDVEGRLVDFRMTLIVMTSNLGVRRVSAAGFGDRGQSRKDLLGAVRGHFRPEFFNRVDHVLPFRNLSPEDIVKVVDLEVAKASKRAGFARRGLRLRVDAEARKALARLGWHPSRGARPLKRVIEERIVSPLAVRIAGDPTLEERALYVVVAGSEAERRLQRRGEIVVPIPAR